MCDAGSPVRRPMSWEVNDYWAYVDLEMN
jgi:hypothetical protein